MQIGELASSRVMRPRLFRSRDERTAAPPCLNKTFAGVVLASQPCGLKLRKVRG